MTPGCGKSVLSCSGVEVADQAWRMTMSISGFGRHRSKVLGACAGIALVVTAAMGGVFSASSIADLVGTSGKTITDRTFNSSGARDREFSLFVKKDASASPAVLEGTVTYKAKVLDSSGSARPANAIYRIKVEVRPSGGSWSMLMDATAPDARISASGGDFVFADSFSGVTDLADGGDYKCSVWSSSTSSADWFGGGILK